MHQTQNKLATIIIILFLPFALSAQAGGDSISSNVSLEECISYALKNQPVFQQSVLDEQINERTIRANLSAWLPQIRTEYNLNHYLQLPVSLFPDDSGIKRAVRIGAKNTSNLLFQADQVIFNNDVLLASKAAKYSRLQYLQNTEDNRIDVVVNVSKAFYDILLTQEQLNVLEEDLIRLQKLQKDAFSLYQSGVNDKIDYKRANISLNNIKAQKKGSQEALKYKKAYLKQLMGYPTEKELTVLFDTAGIIQQAQLDTLQSVNYENRIEFKLLRTQMELQNLNEKYYQWGFLPSVSAFINYNLVYQNDEFSKLYDKRYPTSVAGLRVVLPLFQGSRRLQYLQRSRLLIKRAELDMNYAKSQINTQYEQSMAIYKSNLNEWKTQEENLDVASEVYDIVKLQYNEGIKTYLDVITSETDLRSSQLNYLNALYNVLSSKLDVQRALGNIAINQ